MPRSTGPLSFEMVVLGQSGGPTETELSGYILKPYETEWTDGWVGLEGGAGMGALSALLYQAAINTALRERCRPSTSTSISSSAAEPKLAFVTSDPSHSQTPLQPLPNTPGPTPTHSAKSETFPGISNVESGLSNEVTLKSLGISTGSEEDDMPLVEESTMFPGLVWPNGCSSPLLKAAWFFSLLSCQLITHAHFDHILALVLATGSLPPRNLAPYPPGSEQQDPPVRIPAYAQRNVLEKIATVYNGEIWPELGAWATRTVPPVTLASIQAVVEHQSDDVTDAVMGFVNTVIGTTSLLSGEERGEAQEQSRRSSHDRRMDEMSASLNAAPPKDAYPLMQGVGISYCPMPDRPQYQRLPISGISNRDRTKRIGLSCLHMPVRHGKTSRGDYESTAFFINVDKTPVTQRLDELKVRIKGPEILFWGDVESHLEDEATELKPNDDVNIRVWKEAATRWDEGRLRAVFIECSYSSDRPYHLMFGHLRPQSLFAELERFAACVQPPFPSGSSTDPSSSSSTLPPLEGLKIYIIHVKQPLHPCSSGMGIMTLIKKELDDLELAARGRGKGLGVEFVMLRKGMRIVV